MVSAEFRDQVVKYVTGRITLDELEDWFLPRVFDLIVDPYSDDASLVGAIELCLAEMQDGIRSERDTKALLGSVLVEFDRCAPQPSTQYVRIGPVDGTESTASKAMLVERRVSYSNQYSVPIITFTLEMT